MSVLYFINLFFYIPYFLSSLLYYYPSQIKGFFLGLVSQWHCKRFGSRCWDHFNKGNSWFFCCCFSVFTLYRLLLSYTYLIFSLPKKNLSVSQKQNVYRRLKYKISKFWYGGSHQFSVWYNTDMLPIFGICASEGVVKWRCCRHGYLVLSLLLEDVD